MKTPKQKISLFLAPEVAHALAVLAAQSGLDRSALVSHWVRYATAPPSPVTRHETTGGAM